MTYLSNSYFQDHSNPICLTLFLPDQHRCQRSLLHELLEQDFTGDAAGIQNPSIRQRIVHFVAYTLSAHNAALAQQGQVLAHLRLSLAKKLYQFLYSLRLFAQQIQQFQARWISQRLAKLGLPAIEFQFLLSFHILIYLKNTFTISNNRIIPCMCGYVKNNWGFSCPAAYLWGITERKC